ncbi:MAG TPA: transcription elongation factor GreB [Myxococcota bacterium]|nr:transcription elongation factor GreB [Myxococcota bacterium]HRY96940.1 transcription elongation factor GreB [Myxococcota bacterium]HSA22859.1 transcription elongation factor GreB [Myxococcota bacterium]
MSKAFVKEDEAGPPDEGEEEPRLADGPRHITPEGFGRLQAELDHLWKVVRPDVTARVAAAAAEGDRSENAEYIYGKKRLREIDARLRFLAKLLERLTVVPPRSGGDRVYFGAWVTVEDEDGQRRTYRIVGPDESDSKIGAISSESPVARALLGKKAGEWVWVQRPKGPAELQIVDIRYQEG